MHYRVWVGGKFGHKSLSNILGINSSGMKEVPGMYILLGVKGQTFGHRYPATFMAEGLKTYWLPVQITIKVLQRPYPAYIPRQEYKAALSIRSVIH